MINKKSVLAVSAAFAVVVFVQPAFATVEHAKTYKTVFNTAAQPKCAQCHVAKVPLKGEGKHDFNDYGKKLKALLAPKSDPKKPDPEIYRKTGPAAS